MENPTIGELLRTMEQNDKTGNTTVSRYVTVSMRDEIDRTEAYMNSKHLNGDKDSKGRDKPFQNIVIPIRNIRFRATDRDRKDILLRATKSASQIKVFFKNILLQNWMRKENFGQFLNDWGLSLATHLSTITKFVEKGGELIPQVMDWNVMLVDPIDFTNNPKVEKIWLTPAQLLKQKNYDQKIVEKLLDNLTTRKTVDGTVSDNKDDYIQLYEVHGELPLSLLTDKESDEETYVQQMHVINFQSNNESGDFDDFTLYSGREAKDPYRLSYLLKRNGLTYGGGINEIFDSQWQVNHNLKLMKDKLDGQKDVFITDDGNFVGQNVTTDYDNNSILLKGKGTEFNKLATDVSIAALQAMKADWAGAPFQTSGISEAMAGQNAPSGTAWRQVQALLQESHGLFDLMGENKDLEIEGMLRDVILPFFNKKLNNADEIGAILEDHQIKEFDSMYVPNEAMRRVNAKITDTILSGQIYDPGNQATDIASATAEIQSTLKGNQRFIKPSEVSSETWKEIIGTDDDEDIEVSSAESKDIQGTMATLTTVLSTLATNPLALNDPNMRMVFNKILSLSGGISPLEIQSTQAQPMPAMVGQQAPAMQPA